MPDVRLLYNGVMSRVQALTDTQTFPIKKNRNFYSTCSFVTPFNCSTNERHIVFQHNDGTARPQDMDGGVGR